jgi:hypothetical protein
MALCAQRRWTSSLLPGSCAGCFANPRDTTIKRKRSATFVEGERQWAESVASGDPSAVERIIADDFLDVNPKGRLYDKGKMIADTRIARSYFGANRLNKAKVRSYSDIAIAQRNESWQRHDGECGRFVWTDTWIRRNGRW